MLSEKEKLDILNYDSLILRLLLNEMEGVNEDHLANFLKVEPIQIMDSLNKVSSLPPHAQISLDLIHWLWEKTKSRHALDMPIPISCEMVKKYIKTSKSEGHEAYARVGICVAVSCV